MTLDNPADRIGSTNRTKPQPIDQGTELGLHIKRVSLPSAQCSYVDEGAGVPIVLLHAGPLTSLGFVRVIRALRPHYRVLAPDFPGWGGSTPAAGFSHDLASHSRFVREFIEALDLGRHFLFVNDSSGCIGIAAATAMPSAVSGLVVADTVPIPLTGRARPVRWMLKYLVASRFVRFLNKRFNLIAWLVVCVAPCLKSFSRQEQAVLLAQFDSVDKRDRILDLFLQLGADDGFMRRTAQAAARSLAETPVLILYGQFDPMRFVGGPSRFAKLFPCSTRKIIPFEEHFPILASGERVGNVIHEWISGLGPYAEAG